MKRVMWKIGMTEHALIVCRDDDLIGLAPDVFHVVTLRGDSTDKPALPDEFNEGRVLATLTLLNTGKGSAFDRIAPAQRCERETLRSGRSVIRESAHKKTLLTEVLRAIEGLGGSAHVPLYREYARRMTELVDELVLNALFNANPRLRGTDRGAPFLLAKREEVIVRWRADVHTFCVSVSDPFGTLDRDTVLRYLGDRDKTRSFVGDPSAGLGLRIVFDRSHTFVLEVEPGVCTEVVCHASFEKKLRDFDVHERCLHFYLRAAE